MPAISAVHAQLPIMQPPGMQPQQLQAPPQPPFQQQQLQPLPEQQPQPNSAVGGSGGSAVDFRAAGNKCSRADPATYSRL